MDIFASIALNQVEFGPILFKDPNIEANLEYMAAIGYHGTDIFLSGSSLTQLSIIHEKMRSLGLASGMVADITMAANNVNLSDVDPENRLRSIKLVEDHFERVSILRGGAPIGFIRGDKAEDDIFSLYCDRLADSLHLLALKALSMEIPLYIEPINRYECNTFPTIRSVLEFLTSYNLDSIGILPDFFHMNIEEVDIPSALSLGGSRIFHVHCPDSNRLVPGLGHFQYEPAINCLKEIDFQQALAIEAFPQEDARLAAKTAIKYLKKWLVK